MTQDEFGDVRMSNEKQGESVATGVVAFVLELWPSASFHRDWNATNRGVTFKLLSPFAEHQVRDCLQNYRFDNPDDREPKFKVIAAKLWATRKAVEGKRDSDGASYFPSWPTILAWSNRKSDDDLDHLLQVLAQRYQETANVHDKLWPFITSCDRRSSVCLTLAWAIEHDAPLTFKRGTDEWHAVMDEYTVQCRVRDRLRRAGETVVTLEPAATETGKMF